MVKQKNTASEETQNNTPSRGKEDSVPGTLPLNQGMQEGCFWWRGKCTETNNKNVGTGREGKIKGKRYREL